MGIYGFIWEFVVCQWERLPKYGKIRPFLCLKTTQKDGFFTFDQFGIGGIWRFIVRDKAIFGVTDVGTGARSHGWGKLPDGL